MSLRGFRRLSLVPVVVAAILLYAASSAQALPSDLDPAFGINGLFLGQTGGEQISAIKIRSDGKILFAGFENTFGATRGLVGRLTANGHLDATFNGTGIETFSVPGSDATAARDVDIDGSGRVDVGGEFLPGSGSANDGILSGFIARFGADGGVDTSFGADGFATNSGPNLSGPTGIVGFELESLKVLPDQTVLAGGSTASDHLLSSFQLWRTTSTGGNDLSFGTSGGDMIDPSLSAGEIYGQFLVPNADGTFYLVGRYTSFEPPFNTQAVVMKYDSAGVRQQPFNPVFNGEKIVPMGDGTNAQVAGAALEPDGRLVFGGSANYNGSSEYQVVRLNPDGSFDSSFGTGGKASLPWLNQSAGGLAVQPNGQILVESGVGTLHYSRLWADGTNDTSWSLGAESSTTTDGGVDTIAVRPSGEVVSGGWVLPTGPFQPSLMVLQMKGGEGPNIPITPPKPKWPKILHLHNVRTKPQKFRFIAGTAEGDVAKVQVAIRMLDAAELKRGRCVWVKSSKATLKRVRSTSDGKCASPVWLDATGTANWKFKFKKLLLPGTYEIYARSITSDGATEDSFSKSNGNFVRLKLVR
jgi:uncharacterized delta-60 repeat protein